MAGIKGILNESYKIEVFVTKLILFHSWVQQGTPKVYIVGNINIFFAVFTV